MPDSTLSDSQLQTEAERAVRRGDLRQALGLYRQLLARAPESGAVRGRIATIESLLQPSELAGRANEPPAVKPAGLEEATTPEQLAEMLFDRGDYAAALTTYERVLATRPQHELARERAREIQNLLAMQTRHPTARAPAPPPAAASATAPAAPENPASVLESLLQRIADRRRA